MSTPTDIVPMDVDSDALAAGWMTVVERLVSSEQLFSKRLTNYQKCANLGAPGPGGTWSEEVLEKILVAVRSRGGVMGSEATLGAAAYIPFVPNSVDRC